MGRNKRGKGRKDGVTERMRIIRNECVEEEEVWRNLSENEVTELKLLMSDLFLFHITTIYSTHSFLISKIFFIYLFLNIL